jgi:hypothetical protein
MTYYQPMQSTPFSLLIVIRRDSYYYVSLHSKSTIVTIIFGLCLSLNSIGLAFVLFYRSAWLAQVLIL